MANPLVFIAGGNTPSTSVGPVQPFIEFDSTVEVSTEFTGSLSTHPVESGSRVTDHFTRENPTFSVRGVTSNTPVFPIGGGTRNFGATYQRNEFNAVEGGGKRTKNLYEVLSAMYSTGALFTLVCDLDSYDNCIIKSMDFSQTSDKTEALYVDLTVEQIRVVGTQRVVSPFPIEPTKAVDSQPTSDAGTKTAVEATLDFFQNTFSGTRIGRGAERLEQILEQEEGQ